MARVPTTEMYYPNKITIEEFAKEIERGFPTFIKNIKRYPEALEPKFAEEWMELFQAWIEMETEII